MGQVSNLIPSGNVTNMVVGALASLIPSKKEVYHVDAAKTSVMLMWTGSDAIPKDDPGIMDQMEDAVNSMLGSPKPANTGVTLTHFPDDQPAITIEPVVKVETSTSYSGKLISWEGVEKVRVTLSVLPHTKDEQALSQLALDQDKNIAGRVEVSDNDWWLDMVISQNKVTDNGSDWDPTGLSKSCQVLKTTFFGGRLVEIVGGYGEKGEFAAAHSISDSRLASNRYVFEFTGWDNSHEKAQTNWFNVIKNAGTGIARGVASVL